VNHETIHEVHGDVCVRNLSPGAAAGRHCTVVDQPRDVPPPPGTTPPPPGNAVHKLQFASDNTTNLVTLKAELATEGNQVLHLVRFGVETTLPIDNVAELFWNGANATWHSSPGGTGIGAALTPPITTVSGLFGSIMDCQSYFECRGGILPQYRNVAATGMGYCHNR
jgi:hypothetical protein